MKVLQLTHKPPVPSIDGGCLAMRQITACLLDEQVEVKVVSIATAKHPIKNSEECIRYFDETRFEAIAIDTKVKILQVIISLFKKSSLQSDRFFSKEMVKKLETICSKEQFDVVILESVFVGKYIETIRKHSQARILLRVHNIEHLIWKRLAKQTKNPFKKAIYTYLTKSLKRFELSLFKIIDAYMPITDIDHLFFKKLFPELPAKVIPFGINVSDYPLQAHKIDENKITFFHIGSMNWQSNIEGMTWFLENIWKKVADNSKISLVLAGKGNQSIFGNNNLKNVQILDFVESAQQFINEHDIMVVPLLSGSGMRIKIMEGLALAKPIISTSIGAEGIDITDQENIFIADTPEKMIAIIEFCVNHVKKCEEIGKNARKLIEKKYTQDKIKKELIEFLNFIS